jgi:hypothetical protein
MKDFLILPAKSADLNVTQDNDVNKNNNSLLHQACILKECEKIVCMPFGE